MEEHSLAAVLEDPARRPLAGALPVITVRDDDAPAFRSQVETTETTRVHLVRRGRDHGTVAELERPVSKPSTGTMRRCWKGAEPFVLRGCVPCEDSTAGAMPEAWAAQQREADAAFEWLCGTSDAALTRDPALRDPDRDLVKAENRSAGGWVKLARLSTFDADRSRRLCFGVGREVDDDDHPELERHRRLFDWAARSFPTLQRIEDDGVVATVSAAAGRELMPSNPIVYWNRPEGGALFHHDVLPGYVPGGASPTTPVRPGGQRGVVFVQGAGTTVWLALSIGSLAERGIEFVEEIVGGAAPWMFSELVEAGVWDPLFLCTRDRALVLAELARPDAGALGPLVHGRAEFIGFLIDSGHACMLHAGDAIALPNHGFARTAMHAVYCGSAGPNVGYSIGLR